MKQLNRPFIAAVAILAFCMPLMAERVSSPLRADEAWFNESEKDCDTDEVIRRVCGRVGFSMPIVADPTGIGLNRYDLGMIRTGVIRLKGIQELITPFVPSRYQAFVDTLQEVARNYPLIFANMGEEATAIVQARLKELRVATPSESIHYFLDSDIEPSLIWGPLTCERSECSNPMWSPNAFWDPFQKYVGILPSIVNNEQLSKATLLFILAHEVAHHLDPDAAYRQRYSVIQDEYAMVHRDQIVGETNNKCFNYTFAVGDFSLESFADWIASLYMNEVIKTIPQGLDRLRFAQNSLRFFCVNEKPVAGDRHSPNNARIAWVFRQPELRKSIRCSPKVIYTQNVVMPACTL